MYNTAVKIATPLRRNSMKRRARVSRAAQWFDAWTVEAFNPVFPHRRSPRR